MSELRFDDQVVIITGAGGGLGKVSIELLVEDTGLTNLGLRFILRLERCQRRGQ